MAEVLQSIETGGDPAFANGSVLSDDTYEEQGTPEPNDPETRLAWGRRRYGEDWYLEEVASREAALNARREEEERERIEDEKVEAIRKLRETEPWEYERRMREYNLQLQGLTKAQIDKSNQPLPKEVIESNWAGFSALLQGKVLQPAATDKHADARSENIDSQSRVSLRPQKPTKEVSHKIRRGRTVKSTARDRTVGSSNRSKRPASTLSEALVDEERAPNATNVKLPQSKHHKIKQRKGSTAERASRRIAGEPVEYGIFANPSAARPVPKPLQRNPSTRKRNSVDPHNHAPSKKSISVEAAKAQGISRSAREGTRRSRPKKQSGG
jgi:hypothetical protein